MPHALHFKNSQVFGFFYQKYVHAGCLIIKITQDCIKNKSDLHQVNTMYVSKQILRIFFILTN